MKRILIILFILLSHLHLTASVQGDSLEFELKTAQGAQKVKVLNELFGTYLNADPVKATGYAREALALASQISDEKGMAAAYNNLGVAYRNQGALEKALAYYLSSLKIYEKLGNKEGIATTKNNIGNIYTLKKDFGPAMRYLEESFNLFTELGDHEKIIGSMNNLGNLHSDLQLFEQALRYYSQAWQLSVKSGKQFSDPLSNMGSLYYKQGNYNKAVENYTKALEISRAENDNLSTLNIMTNLGEVYARAGKTALAEQTLKAALEMSKTLQASLSDPQIYKSLSANYASQGKMKEAYEQLLAYDAARDRIYGEESSRKIAQMEMALNLADREKQVVEQRKEDEILKLQLHNTQMIISTIVLGTLVLIASFNLFFNKRKHRI